MTRLTKDTSKIRRELYHFYEHVLSKMRTARINGLCLDSFSC